MKSPDFSLLRVLSDRVGGVATAAALLTPVLMTGMAVAVNLAWVSSSRSGYQQIADEAATSAAKELSFARPDPERVSAVAINYAKSQIEAGAATVTARVMDRNSAVEVVINAVAIPPIPLPGLGGMFELSVSATARVAGGPPICMISLESRSGKAIHLQDAARLSAEGCAVYSNSNNKNGINVKGSGLITADLICSAGGKAGNSANFDPSVTTDCPALPDPLIDRPAPNSAGCTYSKMRISGGTAVLDPGVYCKGLRIMDGAHVTLKPGVHVMKDGKLEVESGTLLGRHVGIYLVDDEAVIRFDRNTTIDLTAPKDGPMAGLLFYENRYVHDLREHRIYSNDARNLLGTIYLPRGRLSIDAEKPVADKSAYTIIVARRVELYAGPNLVMNTGYHVTDVPVPRGLGPFGGNVVLSK